MRSVIIILASVVTTATSTCRTNEIYREIYTDAHCAGTQDYTCSAMRTETGCYCRDGYALDWKNDCVAKERCCEDPNAWHRVNWYEYTCDTLDSPVTIPDSVRCFCKEEYARHDGKCIPKNKCPPRCSRPNEYYNPAGCDTNCEGFVYESCKLNPNCKCVDGRVRNKTGACIWKADCPITCTGQYEIPLEAGCDVTCDNRVYSTSQGKGCYCENGAVRNDGICILKADCPIMCTGYNEVPQDSGRDYTCDDEVYSTSFGKGCYCISGTVRNKTTGACIPKKDCPIKCTGQREVPQDSGCDYTCDGTVYSTSNGKGCYCEYGAVRHNGLCVLKADCPIKCTGQREVPQNSGCDYTCDGAVYSSTYGKACYCEHGAVRHNGICILKADCPIKCTGQNETPQDSGCDYTCDDTVYSTSFGKGCYCISGTVRNNTTGACIPKKDCPIKCTGQNETPQESGCDYTCDDTVYSTSFGKGCYCISGTVRNKTTGACIPKKDCPIKCTGQNETPQESGCDYTCDDTVYSTSFGKGCYCISGTVRNRTTGACIPKKDCPIKCTGQNETPQESGCDYTCDDTVYSTSFGKGCYCISGTVRNKTTGACIPKKDCPIKCTGQNETPQESGCDYTCDDTVYSTSFGKGCYCISGTVRNKTTGACIPKKECPIKCTGQNETPQESGSDYTCDDTVYSTSFGKGCYCISGTVRNRTTGACIPKKDCPIKCTGQNETPQESGCDYTCDDTVYSTSFGKGCYCISGTVRNKTTGACIPKKDCPIKCTGQNETPQESGCDYTCDDTVYSTSFGKGCYCISGTVRNKTTGACIPKKDCPIKCTGQNETPQESGCDYTCDDTVYSTSFGKGCYCISGTVRNKTTGACIPKKDCPIKCTGQNETPQESGCDYTCDDTVYSTSFGKGCYCIIGTVRNKTTGACIPKKDCPIKCTGQNETPQESGCDYTCDDTVYSTSFGKGCYCIIGTVRNKTTGACIPKKDCPIKCTGQNETPQESGCDYTCDDTVYSTSFGKGCYCISGTVRNKTTGACIPKKDCPIKCTGQNETPQESGCDYTCDDTVYSTSFGKGCYCISGTVRNKTTGACIPKTDCPIKCTGPYEVYKSSGCEATCTDQSTCVSKGKACYCETDRVRNSYGVCCLKTECPKKCTGQYEVYRESGCDYDCYNKPYGTSRGSGCYCENGKVRNKYGHCCPKEHCS